MKRHFEKKIHIYIDQKQNLKNINVMYIIAKEVNSIIMPFYVITIVNQIEKIFYNKLVLLRAIINIFIQIIKFEKKIIYVHNLDFNGFIIIWEIAKIKKIKIQFIIDKLKIYRLSLLFSNKIIEFRCSWKILPLSLKSITTAFNIKYDYSFLEKPNWADKTHYDCLTHCKQSALVIIQFITILRSILLDDQNIDLTEFLTISSLSLKIFKKNFNYQNVPLKIKKNLDTLLRESFFGGRIEIFGNTDNSIFYYDFPGMYGFCMQEKFPFFEPQWTPVNEIDIDNLLPGYYQITWNSTDLEIPILPIKNEFGKLIFSNGTYSGTYWFEEINLFLKYKGKVLEINQAYVYNHFDLVFDKFVNYFNKFRNWGGIYKAFGKLAVNSLYGKLGSGIKDTEYLIAYSEKEKSIIERNFKINRIFEINNINIIEVKTAVKHDNFNVGLASAIASKGRIKLYNLIMQLKKNNKKILYCDTDALFIEYDPNINYFDFIKDGTYTIYDKGLFIAPKTYALKSKNKEIVKIKGLLNAQLSFSEFTFKYNKII